TTVYSIGAVGKSQGLSLASSALASPFCAAAGVTSSADRSARAIVFSFIDSLPLACDAPSRRREPRSTQASARSPDVERRSYPHRASPPTTASTTAPRVGPAQ